MLIKNILESKFVSVIIPVYNDTYRLKKCLEALEKQTYSSSFFEIIVVDNGSKDNIEETVRKYNVKLLLEHNIQSSYAARNKGIRNCKGDIIAFIDSDCTPVPNWIEEGVKVLENEKVDLAGGKVNFTYSTKKKAAEIFDSITNMQIEENIRDRGVAKTANLFISRNIIKEVGLFPENIKSGGDVFWTKKATEQGFKLIYVPEAEVYHPTRNLKQLINKQIRVGKGQMSLWINDSVSCREIINRIFKGCMPPRIKLINKAINERGMENMSSKLFSVWLVGWISKLSTNYGRLKYFRRD
ncbi:MAG: glycosyltransferase [bacterium]